MNATIITGGTAALGATVANSAAAGANNLNYTLAAAVQSGSATLGTVAPGASGSLAPSASQACTVSATSTSLGVNDDLFHRQRSQFHEPRPDDYRNTDRPGPCGAEPERDRRQWSFWRMPAQPVFGHGQFEQRGGNAERSGSRVRPDEQRHAECAVRRRRTPSRPAPRRPTRSLSTAGGTPGPFSDTRHVSRRLATISRCRAPIRRARFRSRLAAMSTPARPNGTPQAECGQRAATGRIRSAAGRPGRRAWRAMPRTPRPSVRPSVAARRP